MIIGLLNSRIRKYKIGDIVILTNDVKKNSYMITVGHELIIIDKNERGFIFQDEETGLVIKQLSPIDYTHKISVDESKQIHKRIKDKWKYLDFIVKNCPHKGFEYDDRDKVDTCKIRRWREKNRISHYCKPCTECIQHIDYEKIKKNNFVVKYSRLVKMKKIVSKTNT